MRVFVIGMPGAGNLGDDLISSMLVDQLQVSLGVNTEFGLLSYEYYNEFKYKIPNVRLFAVPSRKNLIEYYNRKHLIKSFLKSTDLIVVGGGGLIQDSHSKFTIHKYFKYLFLKECKKIPAVLYGVGLGPLNSKFSRRYLDVVSERINVAYLRDSESIALGNKYFRSIHQIPDIVEGGNVKDYGFIRTCNTQKTLGCSIRPWKGLEAKKIVSLISNICNQFGYMCDLFVFEYTPHNTEEYDYARNLQKILERDNIKVRLFTYGIDALEDFLSAFNSVDKAIAIRFHANILWQKIGVKVFPISYAPKVTSFYLKHGINALNIDTLDLKNNDISEDDFHVINSITLQQKLLIDLKRKTGASTKQLLLVRVTSIAEHIVLGCNSLLIRVLNRFFK